MTSEWYDEPLHPPKPHIRYLKERNHLWDKFSRISRILAKFAKLNPREKSSENQFAKINPREFILSLFSI